MSKVAGKYFSQLSKEELQRYITKHNLPCPNIGSGNNDKVLKRDLQMIASSHRSGGGIKYIEENVLGCYTLRLGRIVSNEIHWANMWYTSEIRKYKFSSGESKLDIGLPDRTLFEGYDEKRGIYLCKNLPFEKNKYCFKIIEKRGY